jgi:predicted nucleotide-binding protein
MKKQKSIESNESNPLKLTIPKADAEKKINKRVEMGNELINMQIPSWEMLKEIKEKYYSWTEYNRDLLKSIFTAASIADEYSSIGPMFISGRRKSLNEEVEEFRDDVKRYIRRLESTKNRLEIYERTEIEVASNQKRQSNQTTTMSAFLVHGHDEGCREMVARFLEKLGINAIILHEQASRNLTIIEKLEKNSDVDFAVILLTPDDVGNSSSSKDDLNLRARQNVILELGYFIGKLGRDKVCALKKEDLELPSDFLGVVYTPIDANGGWKLLLAKELKAAGFPIDLNAVML